MHKKYHKISFWIVFSAFVLVVSAMYFFGVQKSFSAVSYPSGVNVQGDSVVGEDIQAGGSSITSSAIWSNIPDFENKINKFITNTNTITIISDTDFIARLKALNPNNLPEGQIYYYDTDMNIDQSFTGTNGICGKGTIIIGGNLTISAGIEYSTASACSGSSIGFIVINDKNIYIEKNVAPLVGAYYAQNAINFKYIPKQ